MAKVEIGRVVPNFSLPSSEGGTFKLSEQRGKNVVLFFYPRDLTPTCTNEVCDFRDHFYEIEEMDAIVVGISTDTLRSHGRFIVKNELPYPLLSDENNKVCQLYDVWKKKKLYGKEYLGIERSTFLIDKKGKLRKEWRKVKVKGHVQEVIEELKKH